MEDIRQNRHLKLWMLVLVAGIYCLSLSGRQASPDEEVLFRTAEKFCREWNYQYSPPSTIPAGHYVVRGSDGLVYSSFGPRMLIFHLPLVYCAQWLPQSLFKGVLEAKNQPYAEPRDEKMSARWAFSLGGPFFGCLTLVFSWRLGLLWGFSTMEILVASLLIAFATPMWAYSKTAFRDLPFTCFVLAGIVEALLASRKKSWKRSVMTGIWMGFAWTVKDIGGVHFLWILGFLAGTVGWRAIPAMGVGFLGSALPALVFRMAVHPSGIGSPAIEGLGLDGVLVHLVGLLISPGKGLFVYAPFLLWGVSGFLLLARQRMREAVFVGGNLLLMLVLPALYVTWWHGGLSWGPRFLLPAFPLAGMLATLGYRSNVGRVMKGIFFLAVIWGVMVNLSGLALDWHLFHALQEHRFQIILDGEENSFFDRIAFDPENSMILAGLRTIGILQENGIPEEVKGNPVELAWKTLFSQKDNLAARCLHQSGRNGYSRLVFFFLLWSLAGLVGVLFALKGLNRPVVRSG